MTALADRRLGRRELAIGIVAALAVTVGLVAGVGKVAGFADVRRAVAGADYGWLGVCAAAQMVVFAGYAGAMRVAIASDGGVQIPVRLSVRLVLASFAATQVFAFGGAAGVALVYWAMRRSGLDRDGAAVRVIGLNAAVYLVFGVLGCASAAVALVTGAAPPGMTLPWLIGVPLVLAAASWFTAPQRSERWTAPATGLARRALATGVGAAVWVRRSLRSVEGRAVFVWAACYWAGDLVSLWAALQAFGGDPPIAGLTSAYTTGYLAQSAPIPLIATGGVDAATTFALDAVGVPLDLALVGVVAHRVFAFWLPVVPGAALALLLPRLGRQLEAAAGVEPVRSPGGGGSAPRWPGGWRTAGRR